MCKLKIGPAVFSLDKLEKMGYPRSKSPKDYYLMIQIKKLQSVEFSGRIWDFKKLPQYVEIQQKVRNRHTKVGMPFTVSLTDLMKCVMK